CAAIGGHAWGLAPQRVALEPSRRDRVVAHTPIRREGAIRYRAAVEEPVSATVRVDHPDLSQHEGDLRAFARTGQLDLLLVHVHDGRTIAAPRGRCAGYRQFALGARQRSHTQLLAPSGVVRERIDELVDVGTPVGLVQELAGRDTAREDLARPCGVVGYEDRLFIAGRHARVGVGD